jgi:hypothetical protein
MKALREAIQGFRAGFRDGAHREESTAVYWATRIAFLVLLVWILLEK